MLINGHSSRGYRTLFFMIDELDAQILHALQLCPRVSFRRLATVLGASEQTVARRYHRLRRDGAVRVVGLQNPWTDRDAYWVCRIHAKPDRISQLADALVRREDVAHAHILSGWTELVCIIRAPLGEDREDTVLQRLPRMSSVIDVNVDLVLHTFGQPASTPWTGYGHRLSDEQAEQILAECAQHPSPRQLTRPAVDDRPILDALAENGRAPHSLLAKRTGWTAARVGRRLATLEASGALFYDTDLLPERVGYRLNAMLWLSVTPRYLHQVGEQIAAHPEIPFAAATSGHNNLVAVAICRDTHDLYRYLTNHLAPTKHVLTSDVRIRTQSLKQHGSVLAQGRLMNPTPPAPRNTR